MKVIEGDIITLAKVKCAVCYDDHFFKIVRDRNRDEFNEMYCFEFIEKYWPTLKDRIRLIKNFMKNDGKTIFECILLNIHQVEELYDLLRNDILDEPDNNCYFQLSGINTSEENRIYHFADKKDSFDIILFKNDDELMITAEFVENKKDIYLTGIDIGWYINQKIFSSKFERLKFALNFLFKKTKYPFRENSISITKDDAKVLLPVLAGLIKYTYESKEIK